MERVDLKIGFGCNNRCLFCVQGDKRLRFPPRERGRILRDLKEGIRKGATSLVVTGGEPTLASALMEAIRAARALGYKTIQIQSNGRKFFYMDFCRSLIAAGANEFSPSIHGSCADIHDGLTRAPGSFLQTLQGIRNLKALGARVLTNTVITTSNYKDIPRLARLLVSLCVEQFQFAFVHILGEAERNAGRLVPRKSDIMPYVREGLRIGREAGVPCYTEAIPYCLVKGYEDCVAERIIPRTVVFDAENVIADYTLHRHAEGKAKGPRCPSCRYFSVCEGLWKEYPKMFGWSEFEPVLQ